MDRLGLLSRSVSCGSLASVAAAMLLAAVCTDAQAYGDKGVIQLQVGGGGGQFAYFVDTKPTTTASSFQRFYAGSKGSCRLDWDITAGFNTKLATLTASPAVDGDAAPGFGATSIGVYDGPKGTPCSRVSKYLNESLEFQLGDYFPPKTPGSPNAFDRLELDIEVKADAWIYLTVYRGAKLGNTYQLRSGSSIVSGVGLDPTDLMPIPEANDNNPIVNCRARSDSGPDSGSSDNCRWIINDWGTKFSIGFSPNGGAGEFSLEGGADWGAAANLNYSNIYLTYIEEGDLYCGDKTETIGKASECFVQRPSDANCPVDSKVHYFFREINSDSGKGCDFFVDKASGQNLAASMTITFPPEPRGDGMKSVPLTTVRFPKADGTKVDLPIDLCRGTVAPTDDLWADPLPTWNMAPLPTTIIEVPSKPSWVLDQDTATQYPDWACVLEQNVKYLGPVTNEKMQVSQTLLFWGDPAAIRF